MEELRRILVFILCGLSAVTALSGKGYYCRDPDTGMLHPANSTWPSTTFCGNYTCKLRKKVPLESEPLREFNVNIVNLTETTKSRQVDSNDDGEFAASNITPQIVMPTNNLADKTLLKTQLNNQLNSIQERLKQKIDLEGGDRFLTETEIKTISDLLHNVKKSDLEAIVDIYNLAQDIYKEMDKITSENILEETMKVAHNIKTESGHAKHISYWYDPVNRYHKADMDLQGTNPVPTTAQPNPVANPNSYFSGPLSGTDFRKLPYYYPMSSFQRQSSYVHPTYNPQSQPAPANYKPPCNNNNVNPVVYPQPLQYNYPQPQGYPAAPSYPPPNYPSQNYGGVMKRPFAVETQKQIQPSVLLPYPFSYVQHYNMSGYPFNVFYGENPWTQFEINNKDSNTLKATIENDKISNSVIPDTEIKESIKSVGKSEMNKTSILGNDLLEKSIKSVGKLEVNKTSILDNDLLENLLSKVKISKKPEWLTDPLPVNVLEEVRAHFEEKANLLKPFSLRKKVKLERVGKVVKLDDLHRDKRSIDGEANEANVENSNFEAYIEKTTCQSDTDPGFFRIGNLSKPYPACCPQRIDSNS